MRHRGASSWPERRNVFLYPNDRPGDASPPGWFYCWLRADGGSLHCRHYRSGPVPAASTPPGPDELAESAPGATGSPPIQIQPHSLLPQT